MLGAHKCQRRFCSHICGTGMGSSMHSVGIREALCDQSHLQRFRGLERPASQRKLTCPPCIRVSLLLGQSGSC